MQTGQSPKIVNLHGSLTVERAIAFKEELSLALAGGDNLLLSLSLVEDIDLACLQILYAAKASAASQGKEIHFLGSVPSRIMKRMATCGFLRGASDRAEDFESALVGF
jgi:anti-anti-sigma regulatory factor